MRNFFECLPQIVTLQNYVINASLYSRCLRFTKQEQTLYPGEPKYWKLWLLRQKWQILKMTLPQKNGHRIQTPSSKLMILVSSCWKKNLIRNNGHSLFILPLVFLKSLIVSVAFFLGHPVYVYTSHGNVLHTNAEWIRLHAGLSTDWVSSCMPAFKEYQLINETPPPQKKKKKKKNPFMDEVKQISLMHKGERYIGYIYISGIEINIS